MVLLALCAVVVAGCESTQSKSARLEREAGDAISDEKGQKITEIDKDVKVVDTTVITDANGTAAIVTLRSSHKAPLAVVPLGLNVEGANGKSVYRNNEPGLDSSLTSAVLLEPDVDQVWIHDQVVALGKADKADVKVGAGGEEVKGDLPEIQAQPPKLENDPTSGLAAVGTVVNKSDIEQTDLVVNVVARSGGKIVAAGRAVVRRLKANNDAKYQAFLIGKAEGAKLEASAPATTLK